MQLIFRNDITPFEYREQLEQLGEILGGIDLIGYNPAAHEVFEFEVNFSYNFQNYRWRKTSGPEKEASFSEWPKTYWWATRFDFEE
jgi:hypothetical protein